MSLFLAAHVLAQTLTVRDAAAEALRANPQIAAATSQVTVARARRDESRAAWWPVVDASANTTRSDNPVFVFGSLLEQGRFTPKDFDPGFLNDPGTLRNDRVSVNVRYTLFDQLRRIDATKQADRNITRAERAADETRQQLLAEVIARYYGLVVAEQRRRVAADAVHAAEAATQATRDKAEQGLVVDSDRLAAEVQLARFRQQEIATAGDVEVARAALAMTLHRPLMERIDVGAAIPEKSFAAIDLANATNDALNARGDVASAEASRIAAELQLRTTRGSRLPRLDAFASWGASRGNPDHTVGVVASIDLFNGANSARIAEAKAGLDGARAMEAMTRDRVVMETIAAWNRENAARQQIDVATTAVRQAEAAARIVEDRYENGLTTITELLRAQSAVVEARFALVAARHQHITGYAELLRSTGGLRDIEPFL